MAQQQQLQSPSFTMRARWCFAFVTRRRGKFVQSPKHLLFLVGLLMFVVLLANTLFHSRVLLSDEWRPMQERSSARRHVFISRAFSYAPGSAFSLELQNTMMPARRHSDAAVEIGAVGVLIHMDKAIDIEQVAFRCLQQQPTLDDNRAAAGGDGWTMRGNRWPTQRATMKTVPLVKHLHDDDTLQTSKCRLWSYALICPLQRLPSIEAGSLGNRSKKRLPLFHNHQTAHARQTDDTDDDDGSSAAQFFVQVHDEKPIKVRPTRSDRTKRELVVCPGRMFVYDQWQQFVTAMEFHRLNGVNLVVAYVKSVESTVFELLRAYERENMLTVRVSVQFPSFVEGLGYDPNAETTWNNQLVNSHECLYEFRESASFIAFTDWDELMLVSPASAAPAPFAAQQKPLANIFSELLAEHPDAGAFNYERFAGSLMDLDELFSPDHHPTQTVAGRTRLDEHNSAALPSASQQQQQLMDRLRWLWRNALRYGSRQLLSNARKPVVRPQHVVGVHIHAALASSPLNNRSETQRRHYPPSVVVDVPVSRTFIVHVRNHRGANGALLDAPVLRDIDAIGRPFEQFVQRNNLSASLQRLPKRTMMLNVFNRCLQGDHAHNDDRNDLWSGIFWKAKKGRRSQCYSFAQCHLPPALASEGRHCVNANVVWKTHFVDAHSAAHSADASEAASRVVKTRMNVLQLVHASLLPHQSTCLF